MKIDTGFYSRKEEWLNTFSHGLGLVLGLIFLFTLLVKGKNDPNKLISFTVYGIGLITMFLASTLYHGVRREGLKKLLRFFDHIAIYICIASTYTPIAFLILSKKIGLLVLAIVWLMASFGIVMKFVEFTRGSSKFFEIGSLCLYISMGWIALVLIRSILRVAGLGFFLYILLGGIFYTLGIYFFRSQHIKYNHAIWHLFILAGAFTMFMGIYIYLA